VSDLVLDERGGVRPLVHVYLDGERGRDLTTPVGERSRVLIVAAIAGGREGRARGQSPDTSVNGS